jgi:hypothetical protein
MDMVVTQRVNAGMEEAFEAIARQLTANTLSGVRLAGHFGGESARCCRVLQHHCRRHGGGTRARLYANRSHPNADLERRAQWHCRCSDHGGHDGGRYAPFGDGSFQRPADTHFPWMGWHSADGCHCCGTVLVLDWLTRTLSPSIDREVESDNARLPSRPGGGIGTRVSSRGLSRTEFLGHPPETIGKFDLRGHKLEVWRLTIES